MRLSPILRTLAIAAAAGLLAGVSGCGGDNRQPNIVVVVLDTVRDDHTAPGGSRRGLTPTLDDFAADATVFSNAWATAPWTPPSHASMFTGMLPTEHGCTHQYPRLDPALPTLAELLSRAGYQTAAFYSNPWLSDRTTDICRGFAVRREAPPRGGVRGDRGSWKGDQGGRATNFQAREWLQERDRGRPFFLFVNFLESHDPYDPAPAVRRQLLPGVDPADAVDSAWILEYQAGLHPPDTVAWNRVRGLYAGDVATTDALLLSLLNNLREAGVGENTVVIITSDHGENLGDHDLVSHQFSVHESLLAVPLVVSAPGRLAAGRRDDPVLLSDLFATLLECAGVADAPERRFSRSLLGPPSERGRPLVAEYARPGDVLLDAIAEMNPDVELSWRRRALKTIRVGDLRLTVADDGWQALHDVARDPGQEIDLAGERPADAAALRTLLDSLLGGRETRTGEVEIDAATREQLRSLGYVH